MTSSTRSSSSVQLLNQGAYGCVYRPGLRCGPGKLRASSGHNKLFLSKLQRAGRAARTEVLVGARIARLVPSFAARFAPVVSACPVKRAQLPADRAFADCKPLRKREGEAGEGAADPGLVLMKMPVAGDQTLAQHLRSMRRRPTQGRRHLADLWHALADSLALLNLRAGVLHYDLKDNNVMYHPGRHAPVIIDFGLSVVVGPLLQQEQQEQEQQQQQEQQEDLWRTAFYAYRTDYAPWCPESALCAALWQGTLARRTKKKRQQQTQQQQQEDVAAAVVDIAAAVEGGAAAERRAGDRLGADEVAALRAAVDDCFARHPTLRALAARRPAELEHKRRRLAAMADDCLGRARIDAARRILRASWQAWDRFALAGIFLQHRPPRDHRLPAAAAQKEQQEEDDELLFWEQIDRDVLA